MRYMFGGKARVPLVIRTQGGAGRGNAAQHSQSLEAWFMHIPGLKVAVPSTPADAKGRLNTAIRDDNPVIFIEHKVLYFTRGPVPEEEYTIPFGVADVKREGRHCTFVGIHSVLLKGLEAAERLSKEGVELEVIDPRTLNPLDTDTIVESVKKTGKLVVGHEACEQGGIAGEIITQVVGKAFDYLDAPPRRVCGKNCPLPYNSNLEAAAIPQVDDIVSAVLRIM
jgi:pyruvate dehydrogenase E1 component beta subunit